MPSLLDDLRKALSTIPQEDALKGKFRSCENCHFFKNGYCTQVQPPSKILNVYEAQLCIYYSPETVTTGEISRTERATQASQIDLLKKVNLIELITKIDEITLIKTIETIKSIEEAFVKTAPDIEMISNGGFETGDFTDWDSENGGGSIDNTEKHSGIYSWKSGYSEGIYQNLAENITVDDLKEATVWMKTTDTYDLLLQVQYTDDVIENIYLIATSGNWEQHNFLGELAPEKTIKKIWLANYKDIPEDAWIDDISLLKKGSPFIIAQSDETQLNATVFQSDKTKLKATVTQESDVEVVQPTASDLKATVTQAEKDRTISGTATVTQVSAERTLPHLSTEDLRPKVGLGAGANQEVVTVEEGYKIIVYGYNIVNNDAANVGDYLLYLGSTATPLYLGKIPKECPVLKTFVHPVEGAEGEDVKITIGSSTDTDVIIFADVVAV